MNAHHGPPMTLGNAAAAKVRLSQPTGIAPIGTGMAGMGQEEPLVEGGI
jgi:hypothetical protein